MNAPARRPSRRRSARRNTGQWLIGVILLLAVVGTVFAVFTRDQRWTMFALLAFLWAGVLGAVLVTMYFRDLKAAEAREHELKHVYELQLEREIAARREYELGVEKEIRDEIRGESNTQLDELRAEVLALRANLQELLGRDLGPSYAELYRTREPKAIEADREQPVPGPHDPEPQAPEPQAPDLEAPDLETRAPEAPGLVNSPFDDDDRVNAQHDFEQRQPADSYDADDYYGTSEASTPTTAPSDDRPTDQFPQYGHPEEDPSSAEQRYDEADEAADPADEPVDVDPPERSRAGSHASGNSVADLLARMNASTDVTSGSHRRRRGR